MMPYGMDYQQLSEFNEKYLKKANESYINLSDKYGYSANLFLLSLDVIQVMEKYEQYSQGRERKIVLRKEFDGTYRLFEIRVRIVRGSGIAEAALSNEN